MEETISTWMAAHPWVALFVAAGGPWALASAASAAIRAAGWDVYPLGRAALAFLSDLGGARRELRASKGGTTEPGA